MDRPRFFIAGAPKCGTSALASYLRAHPEIFMTWPKEPLFFCDDFDGARVVRSFEDYLDLYKEIPAEVNAVGEASAMYLYSATALDHIKVFAPEAKIIAMVRNPIDLAQAFHAQLLFSLTEDEPDFEVAWSLQDERRTGRRIPAGCSEPEFLQYRRVASLGEQIGRLRSTFPEDQIHVICFEDFARDTRGVYQGVLRFLGVEDDGRENFERVNATPTHKSRALSHLTQRPPQWLVKSARVVKRSLGLEKLSFLDWLRRTNSTTAKRPTLSAAMRAEMADSFRPDVEQLSLLLGRDLSSWLRNE